MFALVSEDKWAKTKLLLSEMEELLDTCPDSLPRKKLEVIRGFLNYVTQTYRNMIPYLNGFHMTIDGWRRNRDPDGWKLPESKMRKRDEALGPKALALSKEKDENIPTTARAVPRLFSDIEALLSLTESDTAPRRRVRPRHSAVVTYGFGDASGSAYGGASQVAGADEFHFQFGQWTSRVTEEESSNWREFTNLVEYLEERGATGALDDGEVFMFTDNSTAEGAFWKGTSPSPKLCELVLCLRQLEMRTGIILHIIHVSGKRMIACGVDGLSRGDHSSGVMQGEALETFVPIHETALERSPALLAWLEDILEGHDANFLSPEGWFDETNSEGTFVWSPAPAAADVVVERLAIARHKRPNSLHLVVVPRLMTGYWRKALLKITDCYCRIDAKSLWNMDVQHEPLLIFFCLPFLPHSPAFAKRTSDCQGLHGILLGQEVPEADSIASRDLLRQPLFESRSVPSM